MLHRRCSFVSRAHPSPFACGPWWLSPSAMLRVRPWIACGRGLDSGDRAQAPLEAKGGHCPEVPPPKRNLRANLDSRCLNCLSLKHRRVGYRLPPRCFRYRSFWHLAKGCKSPRANSTGTDGFDRHRQFLRLAPLASSRLTGSAAKLDTPHATMGWIIFPPPLRFGCLGSHPSFIPSSGFRSCLVDGCP